MFEVDAYYATAACSALLLVTMLLCYFFMFKYDTSSSSSSKGKKLPPYAPVTFSEIRRIFLNIKGLEKVTFCSKVGELLKDDPSVRSKYGLIFRMPSMKVKYSIMTTDYEISKLVLQGNHEANIVESEKSKLSYGLNFLDPKVFNLVTHKTSNKDREHARKAYAVNFSYNSLQKQWVFMEEALLEEFSYFRSLIGGDAKGVINVKNEMLQFFLRVLGRSTFGIEFTFDGTEQEDTINGLEYLEMQETACRDRIMSINIPFRWLMFWDADVRQGQVAVKHLKEVSDKILFHHQKRKRTKDIAGRTPLIDLIDQETYPSHIAKASDINILLFAGHDTTAFSFSFILMEIVRHPEVKAKLLAEIASVMPKAPLGSSVAEGRHEQTAAADTLQHGDVKLMSAIIGLEYLNWCMKEAMRLWPVAAFGPIRELSQDFHVGEDLVLPKGSLVQSMFYSMFRSDWIDRPDEFIPERWSPTNPQLPQLKEMWIPFSSGKRACLGMNLALFQMRLFAAYFLHYFDFELTCEPTFEFFVTLKPDQLLMKVTERVH